ncbi:hypothetical protein GQ43DRAFT_433994 [Delitschia confertaspora ATCC 74209]|uniref:Uncharacterized protein n=1 Tax=Delitschia confertaspora ATCC 74209 TaxID=1513339 RepID=A0A9P4JG34_9PLEO|nr:hypothetical protein GQ43DRAFT_433994 [Delitschia confertaspora ATCC 74209]
MRRPMLLILAVVTTCCRSDGLLHMRGPFVARALTNSSSTLSSTFTSSTDPRRTPSFPFPFPSKGLSESSSSTTRSKTRDLFHPPLSSTKVTLKNSSSSLLSSSKSISRNLTTAAPTAVPTACTGCVLEAFRPTTLTFEEGDYIISTTTIGTVFVSIISYNDGVTTITSTKTDTSPEGLDATIPSNLVTSFTFTWEPEPKVTLTFTSGTTYVAYTEIYGGAEETPHVPPPFNRGEDEEDGEDLADIFNADGFSPKTILKSFNTASICEPAIGFPLFVFPPPDGNYDAFIQTLTGEAPPLTTTGPISLPAALIQYLQTNTDLTWLFTGNQLTTCTLTTKTMGTIRNPPTETAPPPKPPEATPPQPSVPFISPEPKPTTEIGATIVTTIKSTLLTTAFTETTMHIQGSGCLRCQQPLTTPSPPGPSKALPNPNPDLLDASKTKIGENSVPKGQSATPAAKIPGPPEARPPTLPDVHTPGLIEVITSIILGNPLVFSPTQSAVPAEGLAQLIPVGNTMLPVRPQRPDSATTPQAPENPQVLGIVIDTHTIAPGQATIINGVVVSVPSNADGSSIVVGGVTFVVNQIRPTAPAFLSVIGGPVTTNINGQFILGIETLIPGGPAIVVSGTTFSLGPSGTIAIVDGVTQTLGHAHRVIGPSALTINGKTIPATVVGGSTGFVFGLGQMLTPGGVLVMDGTTFSLPVDAPDSEVVVNGITKTFVNSAGLPILTLNDLPIPAAVIDGTTEFVIRPRQILAPGGVLVAAGTTFSLPADASGSIVVNGVTLTLNGHPELPILTLNDQPIPATMVGGTTQFAFGHGQVLTPGGSVVISGITISMTATVSGSVVVINGVTLTLGQPLVTTAPVLIIDGHAYSVSVKDGITEYVFGPGVTLKPGEAMTISGTAFLLDSLGTELVINGQPSFIPKVPANNTANTTGSSGRSSSSTGASNSGPSTTTQRLFDAPITGGAGPTSKKGGANVIRPGGLDKWLEGMVIGFAGWLMMLF